MTGRVGRRTWLNWQTTFEPNNLFYDSPASTNVSLGGCEIQNDSEVTIVAFFVVSHDRYFVDAIGVTRELRVEDRSIVESFSDWL